MSKRFGSLEDKKRPASQSFNENLKILNDSPNGIGKSVLSKTQRDPKNISYIEKIRNRLQSQNESKIPSELAVEVVKDYILPMFRSEARQKRNKKRSESFGIAQHPNNQNLKIFPNTVHAELNLSAQLGGQVNILKQKCKELEENFHKANQEKHELESEFLKLKKDSALIETSYFCLNFQYSQDISIMNKKLQDYEFVKTQLEKYSKLNKEAYKDLNKTAKDLHETQVLNDIRLCKTYIFLTFYIKLIINL